VQQIVGEPEADAREGRISVTSPLAKALIGKTKGAPVEVNTPGGAKAYEVKKSEWRYSGTPSRASLTFDSRPGSSTGRLYNCLNQLRHGERLLQNIGATRFGGLAQKDFILVAAHKDERKPEAVGGQVAAELDA
jgi:hypothetical protein